MSFKIISTPFFIRDAKPMAKKYPSFKNDLAQLQVQLSANPTLGEPLGKDCYKIRLLITSKGKGKSGGARVITCVKIVEETIFLLAIYDKNEMDNISDAVLEERLKGFR